MDEISLEQAQFLVEEAINDRLTDLSRAQWSLISGVLESETGPSLSAIRDVAPKLREMAATNPWHVRAMQLRNAYVFGRGVAYVGTDKPRFDKVINDPLNRRSLFGTDAYAAANAASFCAGNFFVLKTSMRRFIVVPIEQISGYSTDPDDVSCVWYIKRTWTSNGKQYDKWYPTALHKNSGAKLVAKMPDGSTVDTSATFYYRTSNRQDGWTWGIPDSLAALVWTEAYSAYLKDNSVLVRALSKIAWKLTNSSTNGTGAAAAQVRSSGEAVGGVASMAAGNQLQGVGVPSAQVNMNNGQPLIAAAASAFGVPVIALISSPGESGGSYGTAATLDEPTVKIMSQLQSSWADFYAEILTDLGADGARVEFPAIQTDPAYRQINSITTAAQLGMIHRDEAREAVLDIADIPRMHESLPEPDGFNQWSDPDSSTNTVSDPLARQGNSGVIPGGVEQDQGNYDLQTE